MAIQTVSRKLLDRLPLYLQYIKALPEGTVNISATKVAQSLGLGEVLVRKDLAKVSSGGRRKLGYICRDLIRDIEAFLDVNTTTSAVVVGAGKLGQALMDYSGFDKSGLRILAGFDSRPSLKKTEGGKAIYSLQRLDAFCRTHVIAIGIITVPAEAAQEVCDRLIAGGIRGIWNFTPVHLQVPGNVAVQNENLAISLTALRMRLKNDPEQPEGVMA